MKNMVLKISTPQNLKVNVTFTKQNANVPGEVFYITQIAYDNLAKAIQEMPA